MQILNQFDINGVTSEKIEEHIRQGHILRGQAIGAGVKSAKVFMTKLIQNLSAPLMSQAKA